MNKEKIMDLSSAIDTHRRRLHNAVTRENVNLIAFKTIILKLADLASDEDRGMLWYVIQSQIDAIKDIDSAVTDLAGDAREIATYLSEEDNNNA